MLSTVGTLVGLESNARFLKSLLMLSDMVEAVEHIMNIRSTKDTVIFLIFASISIFIFE